LERGLTIVTRRFKAAHGELDLVAMDGDTLVFIEVKHRRSPNLPPELSIDERKAGRIARAAAEYLAKAEEVGRAVRFDVVLIDPAGIRHIEDAFKPE
jgi:putative endonuclease